MLDHRVRGEPVADHGCRLQEIHARRDLHRVLLRLVHQRCVRVVLSHHTHDVPDVKGSAPRPVSANCAYEAVARGQGGLLLEGIDALAHVDVSAVEACVLDRDLDVACWRVWADVIDDFEDIHVAEFGDDDFAIGGHCGENEVS